jgi:Tol biopolymer transport system component
MFSVSDQGVLVTRAGGTSDLQLTLQDDAETLSLAGRLKQPGFTHRFSLSPDGERIAVRLDSSGNGDIWVINLKTNTSVQLTSDPALDDFPTWSPDGDKVAFASSRSGRMEIYEHNADGTGRDRPLFETGVNPTTGDKVPTSWSRAGLVFYSQNTKTDRDLWVRRPDGVTFPLVQTNAREDWGAISPDGEWFAYTSYKSYEPDILIRPFTGKPDDDAARSDGNTWTAARRALLPHWSGSGHQRLYFVGNDSLLHVVNIKTTPSERALTPEEPSIVLNSHHLELGSQFGIMPGARRFLFLEEYVPPGTPQPFTVVLNGMQALPK